MNVTQDVGIGTNDPDKKLHIQGDGGDSSAILIESTNSSGAGFMYLQRNTDGKSYVLNQSYHPLILGANNLFNQLYLKENGNVGIGTNNPQEKLHVAGDILLNNGWTGGSYSKIIGDSASARKAIWWYYDNNPSGTQIRDNHSIGFYTGGNTGTDHTLKMIVNTAGSVGIGTTNPSNKLTIGDFNNSNSKTNGSFYDTIRLDVQTGQASFLSRYTMVSN